MKLKKQFYLQDDVVSLARRFIGMVLVTKFEGLKTSGIITETEAYNGINDRASHAYGGRRTARTEIMFSEGGYAYIYLCYGIHSLFNIVTGPEGLPQAILIRAIRPLDGIEVMQMRRNMKYPSKNFSNGPGTVSIAMGMHYKDTGLSLTGNKIWIEDRGIFIPKDKIQVTPRIGVDYAKEDAKLPWRFVIPYGEVL